MDINNIKFKDVAHFYIGCTLHHIWSSIEEKSTVKMSIDRINRLGLDDWKPILTPLYALLPEDTAKILKETNEPYNREESLKQMALITFELTKKGFDLFGLIASGQAIDATTINK